MCGFGQNAASRERLSRTTKAGPPPKPGGIARQDPLPPNQDTGLPEYNTCLDQLQGQVLVLQRLFLWRSTMSWLQGITHCRRL